MVKKILLKIAIPTAQFLVKNRRLKIRGRKKILLNLGCGMKCLPHWINVDGSLTAFLGSKRFTWINRLLYRMAGSSVYYSFEEFNDVIQTCNLHFYDLRKGVPLEDGKADAVFTSHFLEHINKEESRHFLRECHRVLKPGGLLRVIVPDLDVAFKMYGEGKVKEMLSMFFYTSEAHDFHMHKYNYNFKILSEFLEETGFKNIQRIAYREGECPDIDFLDVYPEHSLYVEAKK